LKLWTSNISIFFEKKSHSFAEFFVKQHKILQFY